MNKSGTKCKENFGVFCGTTYLIKYCQINNIRTILSQLATYRELLNFDQEPRKICFPVPISSLINWHNFSAIFYCTDLISGGGGANYRCCSIWVKQVVYFSRVNYCNVKISLHMQNLVTDLINSASTTLSAALSLCGFNWVSREVCACRQISS